MSKAENIIGHDETEKQINYAYKFKECLDYIEVGNFKKDLERVLKALKHSKTELFSNIKKDNPKLGTLIGPELFFMALSDERVIKNDPLIQGLFLTKTEKEKGTVFEFSEGAEDFKVLRNGAKIAFYGVSKER